MCLFCALWIGQKICSGFSTTSYRKTQTEVLANPRAEIVFGKNTHQGVNSGGLDCCSFFLFVLHSAYFHSMGFL